MYGSRGLRGNQKAVAGLGALVLAAVLCLLLTTLAPSADAARLVGKDGRVYACYKAKGKRKGAVRLVAKKGHCRKGEKKISWNAQGPSGENGTNGEQTANGEPGSPGEPGAAGNAGALENRIAALTKKVGGLEEVLKGINPGDLTSVLGKLQGISGTQLQEAIGSVADANALCVQAKKLTEQSNVLGGAFGGISLTGAAGPVLGVLGLMVPSVPSLPAFSCP
jgi:hypothetical protein